VVNNDSPKSDFRMQKWVKKVISMVANQFLSGMFLQVLYEVKMCCH